MVVMEQVLDHTMVEVAEVVLLRLVQMEQDQEVVVMEVLVLQHK
jgi:hypothetical protein